MPEFTPSWEVSADESAGNPFDKTGGMPGEGLADEADEASVIAFLKARGKSDEEIDQILAGASGPKSTPPKMGKGDGSSPPPLFAGDRQGSGDASSPAAD